MYFSGSISSQHSLLATQLGALGYFFFFFLITRHNRFREASAELPCHVNGQTFPEKVNQMSRVIQ